MSHTQRVAWQRGDRAQRGRPLLGGRARAPGLPPALPERLHLPLPAAELEAAPPRDRGVRGAFDVDERKQRTVQVRANAIETTGCNQVARIDAAGRRTG